MKRRRAHRLDAGFTLVEMLTVISIIAVLAAIIVPTFNHVQRKAHITKCAAHMGQIATAVSQYKLDKKRYPRSLYELAYSPSGGTRYLDNKTTAHCPEDEEEPGDLTASTTYTSGAYTKLVLLQSSYDAIEYGANVISLWNYNGYQLWDDANPNVGGTEANTVQAAERRLENRHAPGTTIITHCPFHRKKIDAPIQSDIDIVVRLDGSVSTQLKPTGYNWATQP